MKCAFLTCKDLTGYVTDDQLLIDQFKKSAPEIKIEWVPWDQPTDWNRFDVALIRTTWDYTERLTEFLEIIDEIDRSSCRLINSAAIVHWNCRKTYLADLNEKDIPVIPSLFLKDHAPQALKDSLERWPQEKIALKPVVGANSAGIRVLTKSEALQEIGAIPLQDRENWFFQPFLPEIALGEISYHFFGGEFSHAIRKVPKQGDFRVQEEHGGDILKHSPTESELQMAIKALKAIPEELLYARIDTIFHQGQWQLMELELIEPSLYFRMDEQSPERFTRAFLATISA